MLTDFAKREFGDLPDGILRSITNSIAAGDWDLLESIMNMAIKGKASNKEIRDMIGWQATYDQGGTPATRGETGFASGGYVSGPGSHKSDSIPAKLSNGEYVVQASKVQKYGKSFFDKINNSPNVGGAGAKGKPVGYADGGIVGPIVGGIMRPIKDLYDRLKASGAHGGKPEAFGAPGTTSSGDRVYWDGEPIDQLVAKQLRVAGRILGQRISVTQGSYQPETSYSGTSHMGGGTIDTPAYGGMYGAGVKALQRAGFAAWWRGPQHGDWNEHIHAISLFSPNPSATASWQRQAYIDMTSDGLSGSSPYYGPHLAPIPGLKSQLGLRSGGRINYDNTIANLHRGETVLTKPLTDKFENNVANSGGNNYNFDVSIGQVNSEVDLERAFEKFVVKHERTQRVKAGRSRRV
jgi:hypothetical protein